MPLLKKPIRFDILILSLAGLCGALGVILAASAAHLKPEPDVRSASEMLLYHAGVAVGLAAWGNYDPISRFWFYGAALIMLFGSALFACDLTIRAFYDFSFYHYAAPLGGLLIIFGWSLIIAAALSRWRHSQKS